MDGWREGVMQTEIKREEEWDGGRRGRGGRDRESGK